MPKPAQDSDAIGPDDVAAGENEETSIAASENEETGVAAGENEEAVVASGEDDETDDAGGEDDMPICLTQMYSLANSSISTLMLYVFYLSAV